MGPLRNRYTQDLLQIYAEVEVAPVQSLISLVYQPLFVCICVGLQDGIAQSIPQDGVRTYEQ